jgi:uncharacterized protein
MGPAERELEALRERLETFWAGRQETDGAHDVHHFRRVWASARRIAGTEPGVDQVALLGAAYLHDLVNPPKDSPLRAQASTLSARAAGPILAAMGLGPERVDRAAHAIAAHSFSAGIEPETVEARILQDADRLEALGAIGLARCYYTGGKLGGGLWEAGDPFGRSGRNLDDRRWATDHFPLKLLKLEGMMRTEEGRRLARRRTRVLTAFLRQLERELQEG